MNICHTCTFLVSLKKSFFLNIDYCCFKEVFFYDDMVDMNFGYDGWYELCVYWLYTRYVI